jgi:hypothetical protein
VNLTVSAQAVPVMMQSKIAPPIAANLRTAFLLVGIS